MPITIQIASPIWVDRMSKLQARPTGRCEVVVSWIRTVVRPDPSVRAVASMSRRCPGSSVSSSIGSTRTAGLSARTTTWTVTPSGSPLVTVRGNRPDSLDKARNVGPVTLTREERWPACRAARSLTMTRATLSLRHSEVPDSARLVEASDRAVLVGQQLGVDPALVPELGHRVENGLGQAGDGARHLDRTV